MANDAVDKPRTPTEEMRVFPSLQREMNRLVDQFRTGFPSADHRPLAFFGSDGFPRLTRLTRMTRWTSQQNSPA